MSMKFINVYQNLPKVTLNIFEFIFIEKGLDISFLTLSTPFNDITYQFNQPIAYFRMQSIDKWSTRCVCNGIYA